jgi:hypothetical protein
MFKRVIPLLMIGCALWRMDASRRRRLERQHGKPAAKPAEETRWEGEGGALPVSGSQLGPSPARQ